MCFLIGLPISPRVLNSVPKLWLSLENLPQYWQLLVSIRYVEVPASQVKDVLKLSGLSSYTKIIKPNTKKLAKACYISLWNKL